MTSKQFRILGEKIQSSFTISKVPKLLTIQIFIPIVFVIYVAINPTSINEPSGSIQSVVIFLFLYSIGFSILILFIPCVEFEYYFYFEDSMKKNSSLQPLDIEAPLFLIVLNILLGKDKLDHLGMKIKYLTNYLGIRDIQNRIHGFEFINKLLYVVVTVFLILSAFIIIDNVKLHKGILDYPILKAAYITLSMYVGFWIYWVIRTSHSRTFSFYFARACSEVISVKMYEVDKIVFLDKSLKSYNKYLRKNINLQINNSSKICSEIICPSIRQHSKKILSAMNVLPQTFRSRNKLSPIKYLATLFDINNLGQFLIRPPAAQKIKEFIPIFTAIVSTIIAIIQLIISKV